MLPCEPSCIKYGKICESYIKQVAKTPHGGDRPQVRMPHHVRFTNQETWICNNMKHMKQSLNMLRSQLRCTKMALKQASTALPSLSNCYTSRSTNSHTTSWGRTNGLFVYRITFLSQKYLDIPILTGTKLCACNSKR